MAENLACVLKSFHSMFMGSTTDLTPTLIGIYDSLLEPKSIKPEANTLEKAKDARNDPPVTHTVDHMIEDTNAPKDPSKMVGSVKLPIASVNKSSLYTKRCNGANESDLTSDKIQRTFKEKVSETSTFDHLSPNVKRMISSATETTTLKLQRKGNTARSSTRQRSNIPLFGATSKISQSGVEILDSVEIYDQPCGIKSFSRKTEEESPSKTVPVKPDFRIDEQTTYDVPTNNRPAIYDVPIANKTAFESLSLPYIDQSIELSISSNDREFDIKLSSKDNSPQKGNEVPSDTFPKTNGTNSLNRKDFVSKSESPSKLAKTGPFPETVGSTGNLKTIPTKEVTLHPPPIEVTRPLSMSSIASSSSTSSSGVQNKGGVNSAYLASIESLDDHSDADMVSANGSNNFVNNAGILNNSAAEERHTENIPRQSWDEVPGLSQLERVCAEIVQTENVYVEDLRQVVEGYLHEWRRFTTFSEDELSELFNNIEHIYNFNRSLCEELNTCRLDASCIARCFVNNTAGFSVYTSYCTGYPRTMARLAALASKSQSAREFRERQLALGHPLPLASYLLKPVQRILKYHLLLQNVVKQCATRETEFALMQMTGIAQHIDDMKRRHEHAVRVQEIQSLLYGWTGPDLTTYGELCAEGTFRVFGAKAMRHAFLFDKMLLVTKNREDGILAYKSHIMCNNMMLVESISGAPLSFHVIPWDAPRAQLTLQARSHRHKREWTLLLKRVILENYNAVIPSHARQLVMELGQNKTDDDMLAEKSHNLITQASMRKQLSAPEYLEKRKLERDRRKSFENGARGRLKKNMKYTVPRRTSNQDCDCAQVSLEKGTDYTCDTCYIDLCSDCETELSKKDKDCNCKHDDDKEKCPECDRALQYIDSGSAEHLERKQSICKCSDFKSSQESFAKEYNGSLNKIRGYHSSDNIVGYTETKSKDELSDTNNSLVNVRNIPKSCLKCAKIKENIVTDSTSTIHSRKSRCNDNEKSKADTLRSKSKEDPQRSKLSKIGTWRRKSEPGLQQNTAIIAKRSMDSDTDRNESRGTEKIEFECRNCGSNKISRKVKNSEGVIISDPEVDGRKSNNSALKPSIEIKMYNTKKVPKKISKIKKNRANGIRLGTDTTAKFYADFSTDVSTENILHISESTDSLNVDKSKDSTPSSIVPETISKDEDIDEETYKKLIEKTDSFKKNELEKVKYLHQQKVINEGSENEEKVEVETREDAPSGEEVEQPLEQIISQLLLQNREFQKLLKKQQLRNTAQRRHQRLLKSHSNPEPAINKPKYCRQSSEIVLSKDEPDVQILSPPNEVNDASDDDHIYETLRVENRVDESLHALNAKSKSIQHTSHVPRPKRIPSPPNPVITKSKNTESDYVYLSFDTLNQLNDNEGIYDVPVKSPEKVKPQAEECYETMEHQSPAVENSNENLYDSLMEICRRKKDTPNTLPGEYLPMSPEQQSPNTPEIWLSRQKEHFNVSRDRKSGSLPRSFQVITNQEENSLSSFKCKPNSNSKTYLNRDGKVMSTDRPYTIASDKSEISYDDVENYMSEGDILKFNKTTNSNDSDYVQNISQSTLELEQEIDKCYKNNFEKDLDANKNENLLTVSQPNLNVSTTSSCEVLPLETNDDKKEINVIHPEHKIYKPTSNMLSLKNVLSRFKNRTPPKNTEEEINANDQSSPDTKTDAKSPTSEKRPGLNPRSYSKNLLQRFRSIIGDEHADDNQNRTETKKATDEIINTSKTDVKVVITSTDVSPTTSTVYSVNNDALSKSVYEHTTLTESQNEKNNLEALSHSCDNLPQKPEVFRPNYEKSVSMVTNISNASSPSKSTSNSYQNLNKLPVYMQGSKHLGARIAQRDYVDPVTLMKEKSAFKNVNVLINKNAIRPDSLFSNSSFVTTSSESADQEIKQDVKMDSSKEKSSDSSAHVNSDESFYEKSFEKIEHVVDDDVYRDSAVYSDQEEADESKTETSEVKSVSRTVSRIESIKHSSSFRGQKVTVTSTVCNTKATVAKKTTDNSLKTKLEARSFDKDKEKPKAPPVPVKPKITNIPTATVKNVATNKNLAKSQEQSSSSESVNMRTIRRNTSYVHKQFKQETGTTESKIEVKVSENTKEETDGPSKLRPPGNIQIKRLSFERASLDSATRKIKTNDKRTSVEPQKTSKSVQERRMEIEMMSKSLTKTNQIAKKPVAKPKPISTKVASFERSVGVKKELKASVSVDTSINEEIREEKMEMCTDDPKGSWVKQVVNKFQ